jgi:hypothetical protein
VAADRLDGAPPQLTSIATVGLPLGVVFLIAGVNEVGIAALASGGWKVWHYIFRGFSQIMLAFTVRHAGEEAAAIDPAGPR